MNNSGFTKNSSQLPSSCETDYVLSRKEPSKQLEPPKKISSVLEQARCWQTLLKDNTHGFTIFLTIRFYYLAALLESYIIMTF